MVVFYHLIGSLCYVFTESIYNEKKRWGRVAVSTKIGSLCYMCLCVHQRIFCACVFVINTQEREREREGVRDSPPESDQVFVINTCTCEWAIPTKLLESPCSVGLKIWKSFSGLSLTVLNAGHPLLISGGSGSELGRGPGLHRGQMGRSRGRWPAGSTCLSLKMSWNCVQIVQQVIVSEVYITDHMLVS